MTVNTVAHLHLLLNHVPILGSIFVTVLFIIALFYRNVFLQKVSLWFLVAIALFTAATYATGGKTAQAVQGLPGVAEDMVRSHELFAKFGLAAMFVTGAIALGGALFYSRKPAISRFLLTIILIILLFNSALFSYIGFLGGQIMHVEIRSSPPVPLLQKR
jgi:uncharacterized membrane protein